MKVKLLSTTDCDGQMKYVYSRRRRHAEEEEVDDEEELTLFEVNRQKRPPSFFFVLNDNIYHIVGNNFQAPSRIFSSIPWENI